jgi:pSer/pThr/pTyr-binding forkhead associated (FHA) protein
VSRFHCKLFRRSGNFYIEDNKSSNGTLVNGELITERRLFGGEEVIIGETFFRFRIM